MAHLLEHHSSRRDRLPRLEQRDEQVTIGGGVSHGEGSRDASTPETTLPVRSTVEMQHLFAALRDDQEPPDRFFGTVSITGFFAPENIARIVSAPPA